MHREKIQELVSAVDMRPAAIIKRFDLRTPNFSKVSCYGHFGENAKDMPWEKTDLAEELEERVIEMTPLHSRTESLRFLDFPS